MNFDVGVWDRLFGKRTILDVPMLDGSMKRVRVTENWFNKMVAEGKLERGDPNKVSVHVIGTYGSAMEAAIVGEDITAENYAKLRHPETGALYALRFLEAGVQKTTYVTKPIWDEAVKRLGIL